MGNKAQSLASKRIQSLLDESSFVEIGGCITARATDFNIQQSETSADGVITGYGLIGGELVYLYSQDVTVLGGSIGEMHAKKIANIYDMAMKMGVPVIGLLDCAGLRLQEATDSLQAFGELYLKQTLASGVVPQITAILGNCGGGLAVLSALADFTFMEEQTGKLFVNTPNALAGNEVSKCDTAAAKFQSEETGLVDFVGTEEEIFAGIRQLVSILPANNEDGIVYEVCTDDLNRACTELATMIGDMPSLLANISDKGLFVQTRAAYGEEMVTGFIKLNGNTVGAVANNAEEMTVKGVRKAAKFVKFCDAFEIPILTLTNVKGFKATLCSEKQIASEMAALIHSFAEATVPKVNVIIGKAYGSAYIAMNSKAIGADITYAWPNAEIGMMEAKLAAKIMYADTNSDTINQKATEYAELQTSVVSAARRGYVDTIIEAEHTRKYVIGAFEMLFTKKETRPAKKHGTV